METIPCDNCGHKTTLYTVKEASEKAGRHPESLRRYWRPGKHQIMDKEEFTIFIQRNHYMTKATLQKFIDLLTNKKAKKGV